MPFESMRTSPLSMFGTSLILIRPVKAISRSVLEIMVTVSQRVLSKMLLDRIMLRICLFCRLFLLLLCGIESPLTLLKRQQLYNISQRIRSIRRCLKQCSLLCLANHFSAASTLEISSLVTPIVLDTLSKSSSVKDCMVLLASSPE